MPPLIYSFIFANRKSSSYELINIQITVWTAIVQLMTRLKERPYFNQKNLSGIDDVLLSLEVLEHDLPKAALDKVRNFNNTYTIITRNVRQAERKGVFKDKNFLEAFDARFAFYYFSALQDYVTRGSCVPAWNIAFTVANSKRKSALVHMALGVNAHVNNDIPLVLQDVGAKESNYQDYQRVNDIIIASIYETINALDDDSGLIGPRRAILKPFYKVIMSVLIKWWRRKAWLHFQRIRKGTLRHKELELYAARIGRLLTLLPI